MTSKSKERTVKIRISTLKNVIVLLEKETSNSAVLLVSILKDKYIKALEKEVIGK